MTFISSVLVACIIVPFAFAPSIKADTIYTYMGNPFTQFLGTFACPPECKLAGSFVIAGPPPANLTLNDHEFQFDVRPLAYSFTDGNTMWTNTNSCPDFFAISTDSSGNITDWVMRMFTPSLKSPCAGGGTYEGVQLVTSHNAPATIDNVSEAPAGGDAASSLDPGVWSMHAIPEPAASSLFAIGVLWLIGCAYRNKRS